MESKKEGGQGGDRDDGGGEVKRKHKDLVNFFFTNFPRNGTRKTYANYL